MAADYKKIAQDIFDYFKPFQIADVSSCMTRLRIRVNKSEGIDVAKIKAIPGVMGVVIADPEYQVVLGPGIVGRVLVEFNKIINDNAQPADVNANTNYITTPTALKDITNANKEENKKKRQSNIIATAFSKFAKIFTPLIPAFIAAGLLNAVAGIIQASCNNVWTNHTTAEQWYNFFGLVSNIWLTGFLIIVGFRFCELFGGKGWIGAIIGCLFTPLAGAAFTTMFNADSMTFLGIHVSDIRTNWFTSGLTSPTKDGDYVIGTPHGSIFGIILGCTAAIYIEKYISKIMHPNIDTFLTPFLTTLIILALNFILIIPLSGYMFYALSWLFQTLTHGPGAPFGDMFLAAIFIFAVIFGIHQGFIPIYIALFNATGINSLFPILALAGATQVGGVVFLYLIAAKKGTLRKQISGVIVPGILGIGEPIIYGITLPRLVPLVSAAISATIPGFVMGAINSWGHIDVGLNSIFGPSGILAAIMMTSSKGMPLGIIIYLSMIILAYISGFFGSLIGYRIFKNSKKINWNLE